MSTVIALLRAINVGGRNKLPMAELRTLLGELGHSEIRTYIQSGNAVFHSSSEDLGAVSRQLSSAILERFGLVVPVIARTPSQLVHVAEHCPFAADADPKHLSVVFLDGTPTAEAVASADRSTYLPDTFEVVGDVVYLHVPTGLGRTKLTLPWLQRRLKVTGTARNWRTVHKLIDMAG